MLQNLKSKFKRYDGKTSEIYLEVQYKLLNRMKTKALRITVCVRDIALLMIRFFYFMHIKVNRV